MALTFTRQDLDVAPFLTPNWVWFRRWYPQRGHAEVVLYREHHHTDDDIEVAKEYVRKHYSKHPLTIHVYRPSWEKP